jgi:outer membrane protein TolC
MIASRSFGTVALLAAIGMLIAGGIALALMAFAPPAYAQGDTLRLSLDEAVARAQSSGEEARIANAQVLRAGGQVKEAMAEALPQISYSFSYTRKIDSVFESFAGDTGLASVFGNTSFGAANTWTGKVSASQMLWSSGKVGAGLAAARAARRSAEANRQETRADIAFAVRKAYLDAVLAAQVARIAEDNLAQAERQAHQVALWHGEGRRSEYDLLRARVDASNQEPVVVGARNDREIATLELKRLLNIPFSQPLELVTPLAFEHDMVPVLETAAFGVDARPALTAAEADAEAREHLLRVEKGRRWPDLIASTSLSHEAYPGDRLPRSGEFVRDWDATIELRFPIFLGGRTFGAVQRAQAEYDQAVARRDQQRESAQLEVEQARRELERAMALLAARRETVRWANRAYELASVRFDNGLATQLEVSDARVQRGSAGVNEVQAVRDYLVALAALERALGRPVPTVSRSIDQISLQLKDERNTR